MVLPTPFKNRRRKTKNTPIQIHKQIRNMSKEKPVLPTPFKDRRRKTKNTPIQIHKNTKHEQGEAGTANCF